MENLNLVELLKDVPEGAKLYSPIFGECKLIGVTKEQVCIEAIGTNHDYKEYFFEDGTYYSGCGECLLFPSKDNRDWSTFKVEKDGLKVGDHVKNKETGEVFILTQKAQTREGFWAKRINTQFDEVYLSGDELGGYKKVSKFDPKWLKPFDRVMVRDDADDIWHAKLFSHIINGKEDYPYATSGSNYRICIPYNEETKHLVGTADEEPEFYKID